MKIKNNKKTFSPKIARQVELLTKYYDIDVENRVINLELHYEKASEILITDITSKECPTFNNTVLSRVSEILGTFPLEFKVNLKIKIDDYEGYNPNKLVAAFKDSLEMFNYGVYKSKNRRWITSGFLVFISICVLFTRLFLGNNNVIDANGLFYEMLDIIAWAFLWEAVTIMVLQPGELQSISFDILSRLLSFSFLDKTGQSLCFISSEQLEKNWYNESKGQKIARILILITGTALITLAFLDAFNASHTLYKLCTSSGLEGKVIVNTIVSIILTYGEAVLFFVGGVGAISKFSGHGPFQKILKFLVFVTLIFDIAILILSIKDLATGGQTISDRSVIPFISIAFSIAFVVSYFLICHYEKKEAQIHSNENITK